METLHFQGCWQRLGDAPVFGSARSPGLSRASLKLSCFSPVRLVLHPQVSYRAVVGAVKSGATSPAEETLPEKLGQIVRLFESVSDQRAKYEQLMHYAKKLQPLAEEFHTKENKVVGCVSQVWVRVYLGSDGKVYLEADSDSILTKGLAALLVEGLSGSVPADILRLTPEFIQMLGLKQSLTPARNNGFYNMFRLVQKKTLELATGSSPDGPTKNGSVKAESEVNSDVTPAAGSAEDKQSGGGESPVMTTRKMKIQKKLEEALSPTVLEVEDVSHQHAGHAAMRGTTGGETHFNVKIVSPEFEGRSLVKRHRLVYDLLQEELNAGLHALSIVAKTPSEVQK